MSATCIDLDGTRVLDYAADGPLLRNPQDAVALLAEARGHGADLVSVPAERLAPEFFELRTGFAGEVLQKFVTYRVRLAIIGDLSAPAARSAALQSLIHESNRGNSVWFLATLDELKARLAR
jgi:Domain of unknown function (DUF4180)